MQRSWLITISLAFHKITNPPVKLILRSPLHFLLSGKLILVTYTGRRSGLEHSLPVQYAMFEREFVVAVGFHEHKKWWRNFRHQPAFVEILHRRHHLSGTAVAIEQNVSETAPRLAVYMQKFRQSARYRGLSFGPDGKVDQEALRRVAESVVIVAIKPSTPGGAKG